MWYDILKVFYNQIRVCVMKKRYFALSLILSAGIAVFPAASLPALAAPDDIVKKEITAYLFNMDDTKKINCIFSDKLPDVPYITAGDYLSCVTSWDFSEAKNSDGTFTVTGATGKMIVDTEKDTVFFGADDDFFAGLRPRTKGTMLASVTYIKALEATDNEGAKDLTIDLSAYGIDLIESDGKAYFPLTTISDLFLAVSNSGEYCDGCIYFVHADDDMLTNSSYYDRSSVYSKNERSPEMVDYTYRELCFVMDKLYGRPLTAEPAVSVAEKGFDKTLDEYSDSSRRAKELLRSEKMSDFIVGMYYLTDLFYDGGHTNFFLGASELMTNYKDSPVAAAMLEKVSDKTDKDVSVIKQAQQYSLLTQNNIERLINQRAEDYSRYETVKTWEGMSEASFIRSGDTGIFIFNNFLSDAVPPFKWALDYSVENGIKNFIVDVSCNQGGIVPVAGYMLAAMTSKDNNTNYVTISTLNTLTERVTDVVYSVDLNLDGRFGESDWDVSYDLNFAVLTSRYSFSCGNLLPVLASDSGIAVLGGRSGGGSCGVCRSYTAELLPYTLSSYYKNINKDGEDVDSGAEVDVMLVNIVQDDNGERMMDYSDFYDADNIGELTEAFYANKNGGSSDEGTAAINSGNEQSAASESSTADGYLWLYITVPVIVVAAGVVIVCIIIRKKKSSLRHRTWSKKLNPSCREAV